MTDEPRLAVLRVQGYDIVNHVAPHAYGFLHDLQSKMDGVDETAHPDVRDREVRDLLFASLAGLGVALAKTEHELRVARGQISGQV